MALALAIIVALITIVSVVLFHVHHWWLPENIARNGAAFHNQFMLTMAVTGLFFVAAQLSLAYFLWRYKDRGDARKARYTHGNNTLEKIWTSVGAVLFIGMNLLGYRLWAQARFVGASPGALRIEVWAEQFQYWFRYASPDGSGHFCETNVHLMDDATGNPLGMNLSNPACQKNVVTDTLGVPVNRQVELLLRSKDVIHSFFVRELRLQQDIVPGMVIPIHFTATKVGTYEIVCTQLCGLGHYKMRAFMKVMTEPDFEKWLKQQAAEQ